MTLAYPMKFHPAEEGGYWVQGVPPLTNVLSEGETLEHAKEMAREALSGVFLSMLDHGLPIPRPLPIIEEEGIQWIEPEPSVVAPILLRWAREDAKMTQSELAARLGITYQSVQRLERSGANPSIKTLAKVAKALGRELHIAL
jgi:predicted RNase H-like HicB family nuclease/DNA-binding XRE family transcriptional regulator